MPEPSLDPSDNEPFWAAVQKIPGYPTGEHIPLKTILVETGALGRLPDVLTSVSHRAGGPVLLVMDPTPMRRGHDDLKSLILRSLREAGWGPQALVLEPDRTGQVHTDMPHIESVKIHLEVGTPVLSVGSGVVTDIAKHACHLFDSESGTHTPLVVYQTANSVSAYTSNMAPVFIEGVKRTLPSRYPDALVSDLETLRDAPREMTVAGVGDLLAAAISFPDWLLAHRLGMDASYSELPRRLMAGPDQVLSASAEEIRRTSLSGMAVLAKLIHLAGLAMSLTHATTPLSGYEHIISHALDLVNESARRPLAPHGSQVALASILCSRAYRVFLEEFDPSRIEIPACYPSEASMRARVLDAFSAIDASGKAGEECWSDYRIKLEKWSEQHEALRAFLKGWNEIRAELRVLATPPEALLGILERVGAPTRFGELNPPVSMEAARFAFLNAPLMRRRLTLGDLLIFFQWDRPALWERIREGRI